MQHECKIYTHVNQTCICKLQPIVETTRAKEEKSTKFRSDYSWSLIPGQNENSQSDNYGRKKGLCKDEQCLLKEEGKDQRSGLTCVKRKGDSMSLIKSIKPCSRKMLEGHICYGLFFRGIGGDLHYYTLFNHHGIKHMCIWCSTTTMQKI